MIWILEFDAMKKRTFDIKNRIRSWKALYSLSNVRAKNFSKAIKKSWALSTCWRLDTTTIYIIKNENNNKEEEEKNENNQSMKHHMKHGKVSRTSEHARAYMKIISTTRFFLLYVRGVAANENHILSSNCQYTKSRQFEIYVSQRTVKQVGAQKFRLLDFAFWHM